MIIIAITGFILVIFGMKIKATKNFKYITTKYEKEDIKSADEYCLAIGGNTMYYGASLMGWTALYTLTITTDMIYVVLFIIDTLFFLFRFKSINDKYIIKKK